MAVYNSYVIEYKHGGTWYTISNVVGLSCSVGRQLASDQFPPSIASIRVWYPEGYDSPIANLQLGTMIRFYLPGRSSTKPSWTGYVKDLRIEVGIPWNSVTADGNADFLVIECEGALARVGRSGNTKDTNVALDTPIYGLLLYLVSQPNNAIANPAAVASSYDNDDPLATAAYAVVYPDGTVDNVSMLGILQAEALCHLHRLVDGVKKTWTSADPANPRYYGNTDDPGLVDAYNVLFDDEIASVSFSDVHNDATRRRYDDARFEGLADTLFTTSSLNDVTGAVFEATASTQLGSQFTGEIAPTSRVRTPPGETLTVTPGGQDAANYWANAFSEPQISLASISATTAGQHTQNLDTLGFTDLELGYLITKGVRVTLRGDNYLCRIEGVQITADLNQTRFTYYLSDTDVTAAFILNSADLGVLNTNRLGLY